MALALSVVSFLVIVGGANLAWTHLQDFQPGSQRSGAVAAFLLGVFVLLWGIDLKFFLPSRMDPDPFGLRQPLPDSFIVSTCHDMCQASEGAKDNCEALCIERLRKVESMRTKGREPERPVPLLTALTRPFQF